MGCYLLMSDKMFRSVLLVLFFLHENLGVTILKKYIYIFLTELLTLTLLDLKEEKHLNF